MAAHSFDILCGAIMALFYIVYLLNWDEVTKERGD